MAKKKELLVPAGSMEALKMAIHNGCDAVYLGGKRFGARAYATNFDEEEMVLAIKTCHLYGVKIYVTVNTMVYERERKCVIEYIEFLYKNKVDAVIISDLGVIKEIHEKYKDLEIHVSTQAHTFSASQIKFLKELGATRVVVDRELSLEEIKALPDIIEIEVFIHGALCVSYSGECLMSALNEVRSGNRGTCAQYCRMKYNLYKDGKKVQKEGNYLLSTKELNTSLHIKELMESNITSFKIEGRMKSPEYVGFITKYYRRLMDAYKTGQDIKIDALEEKKLQVLYNREFTEGYLFQKESIMNIKTPNHQGIPLGNVIEVNSKKIKIKLLEDIHQEDGIRFVEEEKGMITNFLYDLKGRLISEAKKGEIIFVDNKVGLQRKCSVRKTLDKLLEKELKNIKEKKLPISMYIKASKDNFSLEIQNENYVVKISEPICELAKTRSTTKEEIEKQLEKLGNTPFVLEKIHIDLENNLFIPIGKMNELRRKAVEQLIEKRMNDDSTN